MRMWMVDPQQLCRKHLLGEHGEIHKHRHCFVKKMSMEGRQGAIEPAEMQRRHDQLADEMMRRGYKHNSPYSLPDIGGYIHLKVNVAESKKLLEQRCEECRLTLLGARVY